MKNQKIKTNSKRILSISAAVLLIISCFVVLNPTILLSASAQATAQGPYNPSPSQVQTPLRTFRSYTFMSIAPNPTGVGQTITIFAFSNFEPSQVNGAPYFGWNFTLTITDPSGKPTTYDMPMTLSTGYTYLAYTPSMIGTYKVQAHFAQVQLIYTTAGNGGFTSGAYNYTASDSSVQDLVVQTDLVLSPPNVPLPSGYWQLPIYSTNYLWYTLVDNWLGATGGGYPAQPVYTTFNNTGPMTAHILWTKPIAFGGLSGGTQDGSPIRGDQGPGYNFFTGLLYQNKLTQYIIAGRFIYNIQPQISAGVRCINLFTGELIWENTTMPNIAFASVPTYNMGLGSGSLAYLWFSSGGSLYQIDAFTGLQITRYTNAQSMSPVLWGPNGEIIVYTLNYNNHWLTMWNSTRAVQGSSPSNTTASKLSPTGGTSYTPYSSKERNWQTGIQWNVTIPIVSSVIPGVATAPTLTYGQPDYPDGVIVATANFFINTTNPIWEEIGYDANTGAQLWAVNRTNIGWGCGGPENPGLYTFTGYSFGEGHYAFYQRETLQWHIIDAHTGQETAVTPPLNTIPGVNDWAYYDWHANIDKGMLFTTGYSGSLCAFDIHTGKNVWVYNPPLPESDTPFGTLPTYGGCTVANGIIYYNPTQHTPPTPIYRGYGIFAVNETTGKEIWRISSFFEACAATSGILTGYNGYDNQIYAFGKGLSATTVAAPQTEMPLGSKVLITGTVTDQSPGQTCLGVPAAGTPAIADDSMSAWMEYLYEQQPMPTNATGVPVHLTAIDPNGNFQDIGTVTSDIKGNYFASWTPPVPGFYKITATFAGSKSYYTSETETGFLVSEATSAAPVITPTSTPTQTTIPTSTPIQTASPSPSIAPQPTSGMPTMTYIAISAAVVIVAVAAAALILRRRK